MHGLGHDPNQQGDQCCTWLFFEILPSGWGGLKVVIENPELRLMWHGRAPVLPVIR